MRAHTHICTHPPTGWPSRFGLLYKVPLPFLLQVALQPAPPPAPVSAEPCRDLSASPFSGEVRGGGAAGPLVSFALPSPWGLGGVWLLLSSAGATPHTRAHTTHSHHTHDTFACATQSHIHTDLHNKCTYATLVHIHMHIYTHVCKPHTPLAHNTLACVHMPGHTTHTTHSYAPRTYTQAHTYPLFSSHWLKCERVFLLQTCQVLAGAPEWGFLAGWHIVRIL